MPMNPRLMRPLARRQAPAPAPTDPYFSSVSLLLHMDGANESTTFADSSSNGLAVVANGDAQVSTTQNKFGGAAAFFDGDGDNLAIGTYGSQFDFGAGDFTVEFWMYLLPTTASYSLAFSSWHDTGTAFWFGVENGEINVSLNTNAFNLESANASADITPASWQHFCCVRSGNTITLYLDGQNVASGSFSSSVNSPSGTIDIGGFNYDGSAISSVHGYIDDLRVTKGVARYTANFTPPTAAFPNS
jgi:hypothetical protein